MPHARKQLRKILALLLCLVASGALAGDDWLIARVNGLWTWERSGPEGRVRKQFLNQEVLRLAEDGTVLAVSLEPIEAGSTVQCSERARRNPQDPCSSAFLECKPAAGGLFSALRGMLRGGSKGIVDARNAYRCEVNEDALLEAANAVGLSDGILPKTKVKHVAPATNAPNVASPYWP